jgi:hypothetical protein
MVKKEQMPDCSLHPDFRHDLSHEPPGNADQTKAEGKKPMSPILLQV